MVSQLKFLFLMIMTNVLFVLRLGSASLPSLEFALSSLLPLFLIASPVVPRDAKVQTTTF